MNRYYPHDSSPFTQEELNVLATILGRSIEKTGTTNRTLNEIHGEIYTRLRQESAPWRSGTSCPTLIPILVGKFKMLSCRLNEKQKEQLVTLFNELCGANASRYSRSLPAAPQPTGIPLLQLKLAEASKAVEDATQAAKDAEQVAQQIDALEVYIQEGESR